MSVLTKTQKHGSIQLTKMLTSRLLFLTACSVVLSNATHIEKLTLKGNILGCGGTYYQTDADHKKYTTACGTKSITIISNDPKEGSLEILNSKGYARYSVFGRSTPATLEWIKNSTDGIFSIVTGGGTAERMHLTSVMVRTTERDRAIDRAAKPKKKRILPRPTAPKTKQPAEEPELGMFGRKTPEATKNDDGDVDKVLALIAAESTRRIQKTRETNQQAAKNPADSNLSKRKKRRHEICTEIASRCFPSDLTAVCRWKILVWKTCLAKTKGDPNPEAADMFLNKLQTSLRKNQPKPAQCIESLERLMKKYPVTA